MRARVTKRGLIIPQEMLTGVEQVEIIKEKRHILIRPLIKSDPIDNLGKNPVHCGVADGSEHHDRYLYGVSS